MRRLVFVLVLVCLSGCLSQDLGKEFELSRCVHTFDSMRDYLQNEPEIKALLEREHKTLEEILVDRCKYWIGNGQHF